MEIKTVANSIINISPYYQSKKCIQINLDMDIRELEEFYEIWNIVGDGEIKNWINAENFDLVKKTT